MAAIAATTRQIRVGSAGIMLPHYASLKVAEQFRVLDAIAPGRIDLGLGRAPGSDGLTAHALNPSAATAAENFPQQVRDLLAWVTGSALVEGHPFRSVRAQPVGATAPEVWILGSSDYGAQVAAFFGLPYCFAHFITDGDGAEQAINLYRETFRPSAFLAAPHAALCVWAMAAETEEQAAYLFTSREMFRLGRDRGIYNPLPSPAEAAKHHFSASDLSRIERIRARAIYGTPDLVGAKLRTLAESLGVEEMAILTTVHDASARQHSYTLLAREFGLVAEPAELSLAG
jgi:luciferase family oxidoreductase group 1